MSEVVLEKPEVEVKVEVVEEPVNPWGDFISELQNVCLGFDALPETDHLPAGFRNKIDLVLKAETVNDLNFMTLEEIERLMRLVRETLPKIEREVAEVTMALAHARPITVDVDFI